VPAILQELESRSAARKAVKGAVMPPKFSNPTALGLASFALSLTVLTFANFGWMGVAPAIALAVFFGGLVEIAVGFAELFTGNTFAMTVFGSYGAFWIVFGGCLYGQTVGWLPAAAFKDFLIGYPVAWLILTLIFLVATFRLAKALVWIFLTLTILWILLIAAVQTGNPLLFKVFCWESLLCAATAWYLLAAIIINGAYDSEVLPIGGYVPPPSRK
jgi:succinate-acetate transporter protein